jgi:actin-related protein
LEDADIKKDEIDEIVLVGGSTRIPKIQQLVKDYFNGKVSFIFETNFSYRMFQSALLAINQPCYPSISLVIQICYFIFNRLMLFAKLQYICSFTSKVHTHSDLQNSTQKTNAYTLTQKTGVNSGIFEI